ncbi:MAG: aminopeptidase N [Alphaproteobacteria bacterium]|nr:aminopeptidase N [Alphaproteobacteria bacterium]
MDAAKAEQAPTIRLTDYKPPAYLVDRVALEFDLGEPVTHVHARIAARRNPALTGKAPLVLDGDAVKLTSVAVDGRVLAPNEYLLDDKRLTIPSIPDTCVVEVSTDIRPAENTQLSGLYVSKGNFCTQCEAEGFRRITFFPDRPDVMARFHVTIRGDKKKQPVLLSNGNLTESRDLGDGRHQAVWDDPFLKPSYLFALVAGDLAKSEDTFTTMSGRKVALRIYVEHGNESRTGYAMDVLKRSMKWDEDRWGREYDLDLFNIVAVSDFNMGAMENKSLNVFNARYILADPNVATDADYAGIETVVSHEYFHNWTGNRITCRDWFQLSLKEGLTVFRDQEFSSDMRSRPVKRISDVRNLRAGQFPEDAGPLAHPVRPAEYIQINNFYTATVYSKGAEVIRMMQTILGRDEFRKGMDLYFERHDGQAVTCDDFASAMEGATGVDLSQFRLWYSQAGTPVVSVEGKHDAKTKTYELTLIQVVPPTPDLKDKNPAHMPISVGLLDAKGQELPLTLEGERGAGKTTRVLELRKERQTFRFTNVAEAPVASINRDFSAPIRVEMAASDRDRAHLMAFDPDPFARWEAGQQYATKALLDMIGAIQKGKDPKPDAALIDALGKTLRDERLESAYVAMAMVLPSEGYLADQMTLVDVDAVAEARERMRRAVAKALREDLLTVYHRNRSNTPFAPTAEQAGQRALKNAALAYLGTLEDAASLDLVSGQYRASDNMTDTIEALAVLNDMDAPARAKSLDDFYGRNKDNALVIEKWLTLHALSRLPGTLDKVRGLLTHEAFSMKNPNKVRSLIGAFAAANQQRFHVADGAGYDFIAEQTLILDKLNPHGSARLAQPLGRWKRYDTGRQQKMRAALERIVKTPGISTDLYEIASKSLV